MLFISYFVNILMSNIVTILITLAICYFIYKLSKFYFKVLALPKGPFPLPLVGNILAFRAQDHWNDVLKHYVKKYGSVFTLWMGSHPIVFVSDIDIARDAFNRNEYLGRYPSYLGSFFSNTEYQDIGFSNFSSNWSSLRKVGHSALQKYSKNERLGHLVCDYVEKTLEMIISKEEINIEFCPRKYIQFLFVNVSAKSFIGKEYSIGDSGYEKLTNLTDVFLRNEGKRIILWEFSPLMRILDWRMVKIFNLIWREAVATVNDIFISHYKNYNESIERDFSDALITAKNNALKVGKEMASHLTDANLAITTLDALLAGTDPPMHTFEWCLLFLTYYPEVQKKLRQEIEYQIGNRKPTHQDINQCNYVMSFISEILRFRNVAVAGIPHSTLASSKLDQYSIPAGTTVTVFQGSIMTNEKYWPNGEQFIPERFMEDGKYMTSRPRAYIPFGIGPRVCAGEKIAMTELFFVLVRFLQKTADYDIVLGTNSGIGPDPNNLIFYHCKKFKILLKLK